jgi:hypothetical protein
MRALLFTAFATLALVGSAYAEPLPTVSSVEVTLSPELRQKAADEYGERDVQRLAAELRKDVEREMRRTGVLAGGRLELTLVDVQPNRPTFKQLGDTPGLSLQSFGIGGATIEGRAISLDGEVTPVRYQWYETDIRQSHMTSTWSDAEYAIGRFAYQLGRGNVYARR